MSHLSQIRPGIADPKTLPTPSSNGLKIATILTSPRGKTIEPPQVTWVITSVHLHLYYENRRKHHRGEHRGESKTWERFRDDVHTQWLTGILLGDDHGYLQCFSYCNPAVNLRKLPFWKSTQKKIVSWPGEMLSYVQLDNEKR